MSAQPPSLTYAEIDGLRIAQVVVGDGPPVVMLHGWGANIGLLWPLGTALAAKGYRVYMLDLPGFGNSAPVPAPWFVADYANFVLHFLDAHSLDRVHLFGHSFGGRVGLALGADHPGRLIRMALADSAGVRPKVSRAAQLRLDAYKGVRDGLARVGLRSLSERLRGWYSDRYGSADFNAATGIMRETFIRVVNQDLLPHAARVAVPTLLLWGDQDQDTPLWQGQMLEKTIPDAGLVVLKGAGHYSYLDHLAQTVTVIDYFYRQPG
jgi:pimeloyl-ACP methyl ester carboxylesterase